MSQGFLLHGCRLQMMSDHNGCHWRRCKLGLSTFSTIFYTFPPLHFFPRAGYEFFQFVCIRGQEYMSTTWCVRSVVWSVVTVVPPKGISCGWHRHRPSAYSTISNTRRDCPTGAC